MMPKFNQEILVEGHFQIVGGHVPARRLPDAGLACQPRSQPAGEVIPHREPSASLQFPAMTCLSFRFSTMVITKTTSSMWISKQLLKSPSGIEHRVKGFFYGKDLWKVRFRPDEAGTWTYSYTFTGSGRISEARDWNFSLPAERP